MLAGDEERKDRLIDNRMQQDMRKEGQNDRRIECQQDMRKIYKFANIIKMQIFYFIKYMFG